MIANRTFDRPFREGGLEGSMALRADLRVKSLCQNSARIGCGGPYFSPARQRASGVSHVRGQTSTRDQRGARPGHGRVRRLEPAVAFVPFFGREAAYATPRVTHEWRAASVRKPTGPTKSHPAGERPPGPRSNGFAPGSRSNPTVWAGSTRTIRSSPCTPTAILPPRRNAIPPNICFSTIPDRPASSFRTRAACTPENVNVPARVRQAMNLAASPAQRRSMSSVRNRGHLPGELVALQLADDETGHVRPGDAVAASRHPFSDDSISTGRRSICEDHRPHRDPIKIPCPEVFEHRAVLPIHTRQGHPSHREADAAEEGSRTFTKRARRGEDDDPSHPMPLHGIEDVADSLRENLRASSCGGSEGDEDGLLASHRVVDRRGIEDVSLNDPHRSVGEIHSSRVAHEGRDLVTVGDGSFREKAPGLSDCAKDHDLQDPAPADHRRISESSCRRPSESRAFIHWDELRKADRFAHVIVRADEMIVVCLHDSTRRRTPKIRTRVCSV